MEKVCHHQLPILAYWGIAEVLHLLHQVLNSLVAEKQYNETLSLLVRARTNPGFYPTIPLFHFPLTTRGALQEYWTMQRMIERTVYQSLSAWTWSVIPLDDWNVC